VATIIVLTIMNRKIKILVVVVITFSAFACKRNALQTDNIASYNYQGMVTKIESLGDYDRASTIQLLQVAGLPQPISTSCGYKLFRVSYKTKTYDSSEVEVSGLMAIPNTKNIKGIVCWQHGTNATRAESVSTPTPEEGLGIASVFAGYGYILLAPDYIGLGSSTVLHPYLHVASTVNTVVDFLKIGEVVMNNLSNNTQHNLYLLGFSQGASVSAGVQRRLEINNPTKLALKANAPIAGPYNIRDNGIKYALINNSTFYLGYLSNSYSNVYKQSLSSFIKPPYDAKLPMLFDGTKDYEYIVNNLPQKVSDLFTDSFYADLKNNETFWFTKALDENETYKWKPISPIVLYYGASDIDVSPQESVKAYEYMLQIGGNVSMQNVGPFDHNGSLLQALPAIQTWFNTIK
jgi:pimeloyl-ACP methyl ester carboxylesterase